MIGIVKHGHDLVRGRCLGGWKRFLTTDGAEQPLAVTKRHIHHEGTKDTKKKDGGLGRSTPGLAAWGSPSLAVAGNYSLTTNGHELTQSSLRPQPKILNHEWFAVIVVGAWLSCGRVGNRLFATREHKEHKEYDSGWPIAGRWWVGKF